MIYLTQRKVRLSLPHNKYAHRSVTLAPHNLTWVRAMLLDEWRHRHRSSTYDSGPCRRLLVNKYRMLLSLGHDAAVVSS